MATYCNTWWMEYIKGFGAGMFGISLGYPFDTIKTRIQKGELNEFKLEMAKAENIVKKVKILYKGIYAPLLGVGFEKCLVFGSYKLGKTYLDKNSDLPSLFKTFLSGGFSGITATFVVTPFELVKVRMQTNKQKKYAESFAKESASKSFRGFSGTLSRETVGFSVYFTVYEALTKYFYEGRMVDNLSALLFGGAAGFVSWVPIYPLDKIKTLMQANDIGFKEAYTLMKNSGKMFDSGFKYAQMRAVPLHAGAFCAYNFLTNMERRYVELY